jgi:hypothetical protein
MYPIMKNESYSSLEILWCNLLSRQPALIREAFDVLNKSEQEIVITHLHKMASEAGWQPEQRLSAQAALKVLTPSNPS